MTDYETVSPPAYANPYDIPPLFLQLLDEVLSNMDKVRQRQSRNKVVGPWYINAAAVRARMSCHVHGKGSSAYALLDKRLLAGYPDRRNPPLIPAELFREVLKDVVTRRFGPCTWSVTQVEVNSRIKKNVRPLYHLVLA